MALLNGIYGYTRTLECVFYVCTPVRCSCSQLSILLAACMFMGIHPCAECCVFVGKSLTVCFLYFPTLSEIFCKCIYDYTFVSIGLGLIHWFRTNPFFLYFPTLSEICCICIYDYTCIYNYNFVCSSVCTSYSQAMRCIHVNTHICLYVCNYIYI